MSAPIDEKSWRWRARRIVLIIEARHCRWRWLGAVTWCPTKSALFIAHAEMSGNQQARRRNARRRMRRRTPRGDAREAV